jgi:hypothetical protein
VVKRALPDDVLQRLAQLIREEILDDADTATVEDIVADFIDDDEPITLLAAHLLAELDRTKANLADAEKALGRRIIGGRVRGASLGGLADAAADMLAAQLATPAPGEREPWRVYPGRDMTPPREERYGGTVGYPD